MKDALEIIVKWWLDEYLSEHQKVIVIFYSDTCNKCHFRMSNLVDLAWERDEDWDPYVVAYNAWEDLELCKSLDILNVPLLIAFENGEEIWRMDEVQTNDFINNIFGMNENEITYRWELISNPQKRKIFWNKRNRKQIEKKTNKDIIRSKQKFRPNKNQRWI